jgi:hypothetical protein
MPITAQLADGTVLEFEDGTPDAVIDRVVKQQTSGASAKAPASAEAPAPDGEPAFETPAAFAPADINKPNPDYESAVADFMSRAAKEKSFDPNALNALAQKYGYPGVSNLSEIETFYKKSGMLNPKVRYGAMAPVTAQVAAKPEEIVTEIPRTGDMGNRARAFGKGLLFDFADEAEAAARMLASGEISSDEYYKIKGQINADYDQWAKANPEEAIGLELTGGVAGSFIPGVGIVGRGVQGLTGLSRVASATGRAAGVGALSGALSGIGAADTMGDIPAEALEQGVMGGAVSALLPGAGRLGTRGYDAVMRRLGRQRGAPDRVTVAATEQVMRALDEGNISPERVGAKMQLAEKYGVPTELGMVTPELERLTKAVMSKPNEGRAQLTRTLAERQAEAPTRVGEQVMEAFPNAKDFFAAEDAITENLRDIGRYQYERAYAVGEVRDPLIDMILKQPRLQKIFMRAKDISDTAAAAAAARGEDPAQYALRVKMDPVLDASGALVGLKPTDGFIPDVRSLDYVKKALDDEIDSMFRGKSSAGKGEASELRDLRNSFVKRLDALVPEYREARAAYAGDLEVRDALRLGRDALGKKMRPQQVEKAFNQMSIGEQEAFRSGALQRLLEPLQDVSTARNFARDIIENKATRAKLQMIVPKEQFRVLDAALKRESELFKSTSRALGGSQTTPLAQDINALDQSIAAGDIDTAVNLVLNPSVGNLSRMAAHLLSKMPGSNMTERVYTRLAQALRTSDPDKLADVLTEFRAAQEVAARNLAVEGQMAGRGAAVVGSVAPAMLEERANEMPPAVAFIDPNAESLEDTLRKAEEVRNAPLPEDEVAPEMTPQAGEASAFGEILDKSTGRYVAQKEDGTYFFTDNGAPASSPKFARGGLMDPAREYR